KKALYGLKQAPRAWYLKLHDFLIAVHFVACEADHSVYVRKGSVPVIIAVYVDDLLIVGGADDVRIVKELLSGEFDMKDLGDASWILGIEVKRDRDHRELTLCQERYINIILERFG